MDLKTRLLYWLLAATKGGPTRVRILSVLENKLPARNAASISPVEALRYE
jgi:hypothetical protein